MAVADNDDGATVLASGPADAGKNPSANEKQKELGDVCAGAADKGGNPDKASGPNDDDDDDGYDEEQDEDYVVDVKGGENTEGNGKGGADNSDGDDNDEEFIDDDDKKEMAKYSSIESSEGGLVKTRRQRLEEEAQQKKEKKSHHVHSKGSSNKVDINSIWAELNGTAKAVSTPAAGPASAADASAQSADAKVKITRTYEFAGKMISEEKWVDADSEEAKAHLNSTAIAAPQNQPPPAAAPAAAAPPQKNLRRKRKRASLLDAVITNSSKTKLTTLEKSRLDWATYVDNNKISDELKYKNKAGFLEKQDFLNRVDSRRDNLYSEAKSKLSKDN